MLLDFLANAYLQLGQDAAVRAIVDERNSIEGIPATSSITAHTGFAAIPVRYAFERGAWQEAAALSPIATNFKQAEAIVWFAPCRRRGAFGRVRRAGATTSPSFRGSARS